LSGKWTTGRTQPTEQGTSGPQGRGGGLVEEKGNEPLRALQDAGAASLIGELTSNLSSKLDAGPEVHGVSGSSMTSELSCSWGLEVDKDQTVVFDKLLRASTRTSVAVPRVDPWGSIPAATTLGATRSGTGGPLARGGGLEGENGNEPQCA